jgi:hypothetical protein
MTVLAHKVQLIWLVSTLLPDTPAVLKSAACLASWSAQRRDKPLYGCFAKYLEHNVDERSTLQHSDNLIDSFEFFIVAADTYRE